MADPHVCGTSTLRHLEACQQIAERTPGCHDDVTTQYDYSGRLQTYMDGIQQVSDLRGRPQTRLDASNQLGKLMFCH